MYELFVILFGCVIGSFLGVVVDRTPRHESIVYGHSHCDACQTKLKSLDLIPLVSYTLSKGRCRYCHQSLPIRLPLYEGLTAIAFLLSYLRFQLTPAFFIASAFSCILIVISFIDIDTMLIFDRFNLCIIALAILEILLLKAPLYEHLLGSVIIALPFLLIALATEGMGGGDIKLAFAGGLLLGYQRVFVGFILTALIAGGYALIQLISKKAGMKSSIPFGPFLCLGFILAYLYGPWLLYSYIHLFAG